MKSRSAGCVFEFCGPVPPYVYSSPAYLQPMEQAVQDNDVTTLKKLIQEGHVVSGQLKIGQMSLVEYAAMKGLLDVLRLLIDNSPNSAILRKYFALADVVEQAYLISRNKKLFFEHGALSEAFRLEAALFTAVEYNQPLCVTYLLGVLGVRNVRRHSFIVMGHRRKSMSPLDLAEARGHADCALVIRTQLEAPAQ